MPSYEALSNGFINGTTYGPNTRRPIVQTDAPLNPVPSWLKPIAEETQAQRKRRKKVTEDVKQELRHLQKPLLKFQTLVNNPGYSLAPDANSKLEQYLVNPFEALATEKEGYILLKTILQRINKALDNKKMKLKSSRLRKAKDQINRITNNDLLNSLWSECNKLFYQKRELISSGAIGDCKDKNAELRDCLKDLKTKKRLLTAKDERLAKEYLDIHKRVEEQKKELEKILVSVANQNISIIFSN